MDAVGQHIEGGGFAAIVTNEYFNHKSLILLISGGLQRKLSTTPRRNRLRDIKVHWFVSQFDIAAIVFYV